MSNNVAQRDNHRYTNTSHKAHSRYDHDPDSHSQKFSAYNERHRMRRESFDLDSDDSDFFTIKVSARSLSFVLFGVISCGIVFIVLTQNSFFSFTQGPNSPHITVMRRVPLTEKEISVLNPCDVDANVLQLAGYSSSVTTLSTPYDLKDLNGAPARYFPLHKIRSMCTWDNSGIQLQAALGSMQQKDIDSYKNRDDLNGVVEKKVNIAGHKGFTLTNNKQCMVVVPIGVVVVGFASCPLVLKVADNLLTKPDVFTSKTETA